MATILDTIISEKKVEVELLKKNTFLLNKKSPHPQYSILSILEKAERLTIIAEFKRASPSKGEINSNVDPKDQTKAYIQYGADACSVLTDKRFFKGDFSDLEEARDAIQAPILCKDFVIDPVQIDIAKNVGANIILLIVAAMDEEKLNSLFQYAKAQNLDVLMEVHNEEELELALKTGAKIIGINNRDLKTFNVDLAVTERLAPIVKQSGAYLISESGIQSLDDVKRVVAAGADGILVGETLMKAQNIEETLHGMKLPINGVSNR
ncbi:indole-3-glycerol phosphate synthase TrpC [Niallia sp. Krafla_26]|uniref:indole-3-glycerol phosphate synthase TrpC n=1 Tax=Niallia sp. Krafla_26 TaxID=3064703 RepID=UPI003D17E7CA